MALEEEIMKADQEAAKEEEKETKNPDDLTDEEIRESMQLLDEIERMLHTMIQRFLK